MSSQADIEAEQVLRDIERAEDELKQVWKDSIPQNSPIVPTHFYLAGIVNRALYHSKAFREMILANNSFVACALIRLQLDTVMRLYALFWVSNPDEFSMDVYRGIPINKLKDATGMLLTDKYLREKLESRNPWVHSVYESANGYIHFSSKHIFSGLQITDEDTGHFMLTIANRDIDKTISYYDELLRAFRHISMMLVPTVADIFNAIWVRLGVKHTNKWVEELEEDRRKYQEQKL